MSKNDAECVRFDERENVLSSVELLRLIAPLLNEHPTYWKWMVIAAYDAIQGAMVCALTDTTGISALTDKSRREVLNWIDKDSKTHGGPPKERLAFFKDLIARCDLNQSWRPPTANMASYGLLSAMKRIGRVQRGVRRAFLVRPRHSLSTRELLAWSHPRLARAPLRERRNACRAVRRAAEQLAIRVGRRWPDGLLWRARECDMAAT